MNHDIKLSLSAAREREQDLCECPQPYPDERGRTIIDESCHLHGVMDLLDCTDANPNNTKHKPGWTPAPDPRQYAKVDPYRGRDYEALTKAALRKPVGWWGDEPKENPSEWPPKLPGESEPACEGPSPSAPQPADDDLYEPVGTTLVVGDIVCWPFNPSYGNSSVCGPWKVELVESDELGTYVYSNADRKTVPVYSLSDFSEPSGWFAARILKRQKPATIRAWMGSDDHRPWVWDGARMWSLCPDGEWRFGYSTPDHLPCPHLVELPADEAIRLNEERLKATGVDQ